MAQSVATALLLLIVCASPALAWEARLVSANDQPICGATVSILGRPGEAVTDADGRFRWQPDPAPPFEILVVLPDGTYMKPVTIERLGDGVADIVVYPLLSEAVTVTGSAPVAPVDALAPPVMWVTSSVPASNSATWLRSARNNRATAPSVEPMMTR